jgi:hypothetical protein
LIQLLLGAAPVFKFNLLVLLLIGGMKFWTKSDVPTNSNHDPWEKDKGKALSVELSAYAMLALSAADNRKDGLMVLKWLTSQRNPQGGYSSTQVRNCALGTSCEFLDFEWSVWSLR